MTDRKKPTAGFWITVALVAVLVLYPLSFGPACWLARREMLEIPAVAHLYGPIVEYAFAGPKLIRRVIGWYSGPANANDDMLEGLFFQLRIEEIEEIEEIGHASKHHE
jgi:hypothetical protein